MIAVTYNGWSGYLLNHEPSWQTAVAADFERIGDNVQGLTGRETRRATGESLRVPRLEYEAVLDGLETREVEQFLRSYQTADVACPLWPAMTRWADRASMGITGGLMVVWTDGWASWELYEGTEPEWPDDSDWVAPVIVGRLQERGITSHNADTATWRVNLAERSPAAWALTPAVQSWAAGPSPGAAWATAPKLFPLGLQFTEVESSYEVTLQKKGSGFTRQPLEYVYAQTSARGMSLPELTDGANAAKLLRFFWEYAAGRAFWASTWIENARLTAAVGALDTVLHVDSSGYVTVGDWLAFAHPGSLVAYGKVQSVGSGTITLTTAPGALGADTLVSRLVLVKLAKSVITLEWATPDVVNARVAVSEVPAEYAPAVDETLGTTIGLLPTRCWLYEFTWTLGGVTTAEHATSYESDLTYGGHTYTSRNVNHGEVKQSLALDADYVEITAEMWTGSLLAKLAVMRCEAPLMVTVYSATVAAEVVSNMTAVYKGEATEVGVSGRVLKGKVVSGGSMWDRVVPRFMLQRACNHTVFDTGCGIPWGWFGFYATIQSVGSEGYPFEFVLEDLTRALFDMPLITAGYFAGGQILLNSGTSTIQVRGIVASTEAVDGVLTVTLDRDPHPFPTVGASVTIWPGCDGNYVTCREKFNNFLNFGGHPFLPAGNPSAVRPPSGSSTGGGKKS